MCIRDRVNVVSDFDGDDGDEGETNVELELYGQGVGNATLQAVVDGQVKAECEVEVKAPNFKLSKSSVKVDANKDADNHTAEVELITDYEDAFVDAEVGDDQIAVVDQDGNIFTITGLKAGETELVVTIDGLGEKIELTCKVTVVDTCLLYTSRCV